MLDGTPLAFEVMTTVREQALDRPAREGHAHVQQGRTAARLSMRDDNGDRGRAYPLGLATRSHERNWSELCRSSGGQNH
jgi:hypothetical protein